MPTRCLDSVQLIWNSVGVKCWHFHVLFLTTVSCQCRNRHCCVIKTQVDRWYTAPVETWHKILVVFRFLWAWCWLPSHLKAEQDLWRACWMSDADCALCRVTLPPEHCYYEVLQEPGGLPHVGPFSQLVNFSGSYLNCCCFKAPVSPQQELSLVCEWSCTHRSVMKTCQSHIPAGETPLCVTVNKGCDDCKCCAMRNLSFSLGKTHIWCLLWIKCHSHVTWYLQICSVTGTYTCEIFVFL